MKGLKDTKYYDTYIKERTQGYLGTLAALKNGKVVDDLVSLVKKSVFEWSLQVLIAQYSRGDSKQSLLKQYKSTLGYMQNSWEQQDVKVFYGRKQNELDQYDGNSFVQMLWMLSLGVLLEVPKNEFKILVSFIDRDKVKDFLYEFLIHSYLPNRPKIKEESYRKFFGINKLYGYLKDLIDLKDDKVVEKRTKTYLEKKWYPSFKDYAWYDSHKSDYFSFFGYWCFSAAAIVKIRNLDDSKFKDCLYYPDNLLH